MLETERTAAEVERELVALAAALERSLSRWLALVGEFDALGAARRAGFRSMVEWLAWRCGLSLRAAREHVRVARRLRDMPGTRAAFADGTLSYSKVRVLTRAHASEDEEALLAVAAQSTAAQLSAHVRQLATAASADPEVERRVHDQRYVDWWWDHDGGLQLRGKLPAVDGALVVDALERAAETLHPAADASAAAGERPPAWSRPPLGARRADALTEILACGGGGPQAQIVVHVDAGTLCAIEDGPAIPPATAHRLACDATAVLAGAGGACDSGRRRRFPTPAKRAEVVRRDGGCRFPGCVRRHAVQAHHIQLWSHGGPTDSDNLVLVCRFHHRLLHEEGFTAIRKNGDVLFFASDGRRIPAVPDPSRAPPPVAAAA